MFIDDKQSRIEVFAVEGRGSLDWRRGRGIFVETQTAKGGC